MRTLVAVITLSLLAVPCLFAEDSQYHTVQFSNGSQPTNTMGYWDDGGYARSLLGGNNLSSGNTATPPPNLSYSAQSAMPTAPVDANSSQDSENLVSPRALATQTPTNIQQNDLQP